jgi:hypothetical protein
MDKMRLRHVKEIEEARKRLDNNVKDKREDFTKCVGDEGKARLEAGQEYVSEQLEWRRQAELVKLEEEQRLARTKLRIEEERKLKERFNAAGDDEAEKERLKEQHEKQLKRFDRILEEEQAEQRRQLEVSECVCVY